MSGSEVDSSSINMERSVAVLEHGLDHKRRPSLGDMRDMRYLTPEQVEDMVISAASEHKRRESRQAFLQGRLMAHMYEEGQAAEIAGMMTQFIPTAEDNSVQLSKGLTLVEETAQPKYTGLSSKMKAVHTTTHPASSSIASASVSSGITITGPTSSISSTSIRSGRPTSSVKAITYGTGPSKVTVHYDPLSAFVPMAPNRRRLTVTKLESALNPKRRPSIVKVVEEGLIPDDFLKEVYGLAEDVRKDHRRMASAVDDMADSLGMDPTIGRLIAEQTLSELEEFDPRLQPIITSGSTIDDSSSGVGSRRVIGEDPNSSMARGVSETNDISESRVKVLEHRIALLEAELTRSRDPMNASGASLIETSSSMIGGIGEKDDEESADHDDGHHVLTRSIPVRPPLPDNPLELADECRRLRRENDDLHRTVGELERSRMDVLIALNCEMEKVRSLLKSYSCSPPSSRSKWKSMSREVTPD